MKNLTTLIIHPKDSTTDFLSEIYKGVDCTLLNYNISNSKLKRLIKSHDRIIMMGHGTEFGLFGYGKYIIDSDLVYLLRDKPNSVYIWCNADQFAKKYGLKGFITGMIISEWEEALMYSIIPTLDLLTESNTLFADSIKESIHLSPKDMLDKAKELYKPNDNPIISFNAYQMYFFD